MGDNFRTLADSHHALCGEGFRFRLERDDVESISRFQVLQHKFKGRFKWFISKFDVLIIGHRF